MVETVSQHYYQYYQYEIPTGEEPGKVVNHLYDAVMRNNKAALEQVLKILGSNTYYMIYRRLDNIGKATLDNVDDIMQNIRFEIIKMAFRGFPEERIKEQYHGNFYGWLIGFSENHIKNYKKNDENYSKHLQYDAINYSVFDVIEEKSSDGENVSPEQEIINKEKIEMIDKILKEFIVSLQNSNMLPYQLLTYCYAVLLPQIFKKTNKKELLRQVNYMSGRTEKGRKSYYNEKENCLGGAIARDSVILMNWALDAMEEQTIQQLNGEFLRLYEMERIADMPFQWGTDYCESLQSEYKKNIPMTQLVITDAFEKNTIKNWPPRVAKALYLDMEKQLIFEKNIQERVVNIVEEMLR